MASEAGDRGIDVDAAAEGLQRNQQTPPASTTDCVTAPTPAAPSSHVSNSATSFPHRRRLIGRRRVARRSPPSQLVSVTKRFIAIEEHRVTTERILAENQRELINVLREMSGVWSRQSQALLDIANKITHS